MRLFTVPPTTVPPSTTLEAILDGPLSDYQSALLVSCLLGLFTVALVCGRLLWSGRFGGGR